MRFRPIRFAVLAAAALLASPLAAEDYPLPLLAGAAAYSETSYEGEWEESWDESREYEGEVVYMDDLEEGEEWRSGGGETRVETIVRRDPRPLPPPRTGEPARGGDHRPGYGEAERGAWLAECRSRMSQGRDYAVDACGDYLARYEAGTGGYGYDYGYGGQAAQGCGSCGCKGNCGAGCGGECGCSVSYRFAPMPVMQVAQRQQTRIRRTITTEEWEEEAPGKTVRVIQAPPRPVPTKLVPVAPAPRPIKPRYSK